MTDFAERHIGPSPSERRHMLDALGYTSLDELITAALPPGAEQVGIGQAGISLPEPARPEAQADSALTETQAQAELRRMAAKNQVLTSMIGQGYHGTITPAVIRRNVLENPAWYTAYTPYQPEISQGRLEALLNFQTMVADLTALPWAGASLLDEATAAAEAMTLSRRAGGTTPRTPRAPLTKFLADADCLPATLAVLRTRAEPLGIDLEVAALTPELIAHAEGLFGVLVQYPGASGAIRPDLAALIDAAHANGALATVCADPLALTLLRPPGELGADIAIGSTQRFGVPMWFGGPHAAYIAVTDKLKRQLPGRIVGVSVDADGQPAYRLALQAREQHIRREKATSNICTAQVLLAVTAAMYAVYHGPDGLAAIARASHRSAAKLAAALQDHDVRTDGGFFFDTIRFWPGDASAVVDRARAAGYNLYLAPDGAVQLTCDETTTGKQLREVAAAILGRPVDLDDVGDRLPDELLRTSEFLTHPVFHAHRSETAMLRYLRRLADFDIALDRSMIPLGSCTMKLNAAAEMEPISWPEFADMHPLAPPSQAEGYAELISSLEQRLAALTGYDAVSVQPNAGSQGELAGLLAIRAYHASRGEAERDVCLLPESAHGTNAASAVLAGLRVVVVKCGGDGTIDLGDIRARLSAHEGRVAAIMLTYPSTAGVYEQTVTEVCSLVHEAGGQVYMDGANFNALAGVATLPSLGADVSHLNLHKTFCIPHGGGGPGVGPVAVRSHLAPFIPGTSATDKSDISANVRQVGPVAAAPHGSAGILPISWAYVAMMGAGGLRAATQVAVLSANYLAKRLAPHFPVLYTGRGGLVAHECVIDLRPLTAQTGITVEDVAKRLIDYGFHAPTMSFPVAGTFMIEPTESENVAELDRFCDAMLSIREEIARVASGEYDRQDNPLKNAPHTAEMLIVGEWKHPYERDEAAYPDGSPRRGKYFPPVRRIDQAYGDRNLMCSCPPPEAFA